jgi:hypothetical protein
MKNTADRPEADTAKGLSDAELSNEAAEELPDREAMSIISIHGCMPTVGNVAIPINEASAANVNSVNSTAIADADQIIILDQDTTVEDR